MNWLVVLGGAGENGRELSRTLAPGGHCTGVEEPARDLGSILELQLTCHVMWNCHFPLWGCFLLCLMGDTL